jgi:hypothetical protein
MMKNAYISQEGSRNEAHRNNRKEGYPCTLIRKREKHIQDNWNNNQKLAVASVLAAIVHLFPPSQLGIIPLIFSEWCSLLPVEETVSHLQHPCLASINN